MQPRAILVFGQRASVSLGIDDEWVDEVYANHRGRVFARGHFFGSPAVYCHHLSQGCKAEEVAYCLNEVKSLIGEKTKLDPSAFSQTTLAGHVSSE